MKEIPLGNSGRVALIDDIDFDEVARHVWFMARGRGATRYAATSRMRPRHFMHKLVAERAGMDISVMVDHRNRDGLDNRRSNLRPATHAQNGWNQQRGTGRSGFPGVHRNRSAWAVRFDHLGAPVYFGTHRDLEVAKTIAAEALIRLRGEYLEQGTRDLCVAQLQRGGRAAA